MTASNEPAAIGAGLQQVREALLLAEQMHLTGLLNDDNGLWERVQKSRRCALATLDTLIQQVEAWNTRATPLNEVLDNPNTEKSVIRAMGKVDSDDIGHPASDEDYAPYAQAALAAIKKQMEGK